MKRLSVLVALFATALLAGCASSPDDDDDTLEIAMPEGNVAAQRLGYQPRVKLADLRAAGARCVGTMCTLNGIWDCKGGGYCTKVSN